MSSKLRASGCWSSDTRRRAEVVEHALLAARQTREADTAAVPDQKVREAAPVLTRHELHQVALDLHRILLLGEAEPLREPAHVRVDHDALRLADLCRHHVGRLTRYAGEPDELLQSAGNLPVELL